MMGRAATAYRCQSCGFETANRKARWEHVLDHARTRQKESPMGIDRVFMADLSSTSVSRCDYRDSDGRRCNQRAGHDSPHGWYVAPSVPSSLGRDEIIGIIAGCPSDGDTVAALKRRLQIYTAEIEDERWYRAQGG